MRPRRQRRVVVALLAEERQELLRVLRDELRELRVPRAELLQDGLKHLWLLLHDLAELLELRVVPEEVEVAESRLARGGAGTGSRSGHARVSAAATSSAALLGGEVEEVDVALLTSAGGLARRAGGRRRRGSGSRGAPLLLDVLGDALHTSGLARLTCRGEKVKGAIR